MYTITAGLYTSHHINDDNLNGVSSAFQDIPLFAATVINCKHPSSIIWTHQTSRGNNKVVVISNRHNLIIENMSSKTAGIYRCIGLNNFQIQVVATSLLKLAKTTC